MSGVLVDIQLANRRFPWGRGNRRDGSELDKAEPVCGERGLLVVRRGCSVSRRFVIGKAGGGGEVGSGSSSITGRYTTATARATASAYHMRKKRWISSADTILTLGKRLSRRGRGGGDRCAKCGWRGLTAGSLMTKATERNEGRARRGEAKASNIHQVFNCRQ